MLDGFWLGMFMFACGWLFTYALSAMLASIAPVRPLAACRVIAASATGLGLVLHAVPLVLRGYDEFMLALAGHAFLALAAGAWMAFFRARPRPRASNEAFGRPGPL
jgi:hypothetical protein